MKNLFCRLISLHAHHSTEKDGDELFLKLNNEKVWPQEERFFPVQNSQVKINQLLSVEKETKKLSLDLYEYDSFISSKRIGVFSLNTELPGGPFTTDLKRTEGGDYARYSIEWELIYR